MLYEVSPYNMMRFLLHESHFYLYLEQHPFRETSYIRILLIDCPYLRVLHEFLIMNMTIAQSPKPYVTYMIRTSWIDRKTGS